MSVMSFFVLLKKIFFHLENQYFRHNLGYQNTNIGRKQVFLISFNILIDTTLIIKD